MFSCRGEILEAKFGRSSKPSPRLIVVTNNKFYIIAQLLANGQFQISVERAIPLGAIKFIGTSACRDDWFSLGVGSAQEADPLMTCVLKTEMFTQMQRVMPGGFNLKIGDAIEYAKKPNKLQHVKVAKDSQQAVDFYKSGAIHTQQGEPPNSVSRPMPKAKPVPPRPITRGKLIKPGGPGGRPSRITGNRNTQPRPGGGPRVVPQPVAVSATPSANQAVETRTLTNNKPLPSHTRNQSSTSEAATRAPPPPPPAAPIAKPKVMAKVLYDFNGQRDNELSIKAGVMLEIVQKENNGMAFRIKIIHETISLIPLTMCRLVAS
jgi:myosin-1